VDLAAEADRIEAERPLVALGGGGRRREAVDRELLDRSRLDVLDPTGVEIFDQRLLRRDFYDIKPQRLVAGLPDAEHRLRGVVEREALRCGECEAELGVEKFAAAYKAVDRVLAID